MVKNTKKELHPGDVFTIPLFLPAYQTWRKPIEDMVDYKKYSFPPNDIYAFGRFIEHYVGNFDLVEIFSYIGQIPESPEEIIDSGWLFDPVMVVGVFYRQRWRVLFDTPEYDKWTDSNYDNISFLLYDELWKGGKKQFITQQQKKELYQSGILDMVMYSGVQLEQKIRSNLTMKGIELHYEQIVEERQNDYPQPRDPDRKLKETISPFCWMKEDKGYSISLEAGLFNQECFEKNNLLGNGYDWEKVAVTFIEMQMPEYSDSFTFDCEADTFSMQSSSKKKLKEFALAFHKFVLDFDAFEKFLSHF